MSIFLLSARKVEDGDFTNEPGEPHYLIIPDDANEIKTSHIIDNCAGTAANIWIDQLLSLTPKNIVIYIHGYNYSHDQLLLHTRNFNIKLSEEGFDGIVVGFDWPSAKLLINYIEDRIDAKACASQLFTSLVWLLANKQKNEHNPGIQLLAHSTGAFIVKEAFEQTLEQANNPEEANFIFDKIVFFAGDVGLHSIENIPSEDFIFKHCEHFINYYNEHDEALASSNLIRLGLAPRVGQHGLADNMPDNCLDINCADRYEVIKCNAPDNILHPIAYAYFSHMWYFEDNVWFKSLAKSLTLGNTQAPDTSITSQKVHLV